MASFFVSCPIHFENHLVEEMKSFWFEMMDLDGLPTREALPEFFVEPGGVEFKAPEHIGYQINFFSKLAHRILIRVHRFPARFFDQYEKELAALPLKKWLAPHSKIHVKIETAKSRLNHERNLIESATRALKTLGFSVADKEHCDHQLYIRIQKDQAMISLDTSGDHLHRRGYAIYRGEAPLRENLAALMSQQIYNLGVDLQKIQVMDPFVGSGTTLFEMASFHKPNFKRPYAWLKFLNRPKMFSSETWMKNYRWLQSANEVHVVGIDKDSKSIENFKKNQISFQDFFPEVKLDTQSLCEDSGRVQKDQLRIDRPVWIISNPPYGLRLKEDGVVDAFKHIESLFPVAGAVVLHPESLRISFNQMKKSSEIDFSNQGLNIKMSVFKR